MTPTPTVAARVSGTITDDMVERATMALLGHAADPASGVDWTCNRSWTVNEVREQMRAALLAAIQPDPEPKPVATTSVSYKLQWLAGARPPAHPDPMKGSAAFDTSEAAMAFFSRLADDAKLISLTRTETITTNTDALNIGNSDSHSPSSAGTVSVEAAARVLMASSERGGLAVLHDEIRQSVGIRRGVVAEQDVWDGIIAGLRALAGEGGR